MRIVISSINYHPELTGIGKYTGEMAEWLAEKGHEVQVVVAPPYYPEWKVHKNYSSWLYKKTKVNGVSVIRCPLYVPTNLSGIKRVVHLASFAISSLPVMLNNIFSRPDIIIVIEPPILSAPTALLVSFLSGSKAWLHIQDFEIETAFDLKILNGALARKSAIVFENFLLKRFDVISTISQGMLDRLSEKNITSDKQVFFPNWVDCDEIYPLDHISDFRNKLGINDKDIVALYSGNIGEKQGLEIVIESARSLINEKGLKFVICGQGGALKRLKESAKGLDNIIWLPLQPFELLNQLLNLADIHLLPQKKDVADLVMPSKLTGMLASGRPVLATALHGTQLATALDGSGIVVPPDDVEMFVLSLKALVNDHEKRKILGAHARDYALNNLNQNVILSKFEQTLINLTQ